MIYLNLVNELICVLCWGITIRLILIRHLNSETKVARFNTFAFVLMCVPFKEIFWELGVFWTAFHGLLLFLGGYWRMKWLLVLSENGKIVPWKEYLKYVPVDWKSYRCHRYQVLLSYTGKIFLCFVIIQMVFQILSKAFMGTELSFEGIAYAAAMCSGSILLPGVFFIWKCC